MPNRMSSTFAVTKSPPELVGPCEPLLPPTTANLTLSCLDKALALLSYPVESLHVFERGVQQPATTIRRALSRALVPYYPIAGRLATGTQDGEPCIACTGEGVAFVAASTNCTLEDVKFLEPPLAIPLQELSAEDGGQTGPLLSMQVTEFACGGFVVGVTWQHLIADGIGIAQFLQAVAELARGLPSPAVVPVRYDGSLTGLPPMIPALSQETISTSPQEFAYSDVTVPSSYINRIKAEFAEQSGGLPCTTWEVVTAAIWQCRTRAIHPDPGAPSALVFTIDVRKHVNAKAGYYGNCCTMQPIVAASGRVAAADVKDLVRLIQDAKRQVVSQYKNGVGAIGEVGGEDTGVLRGYNILYASSWRNIGFEGVDFGGGRPVRVMYNVTVKVLPNCIPCLPWTRKEGANVIGFCVTEKDAAAFQEEIARLR